MILMLCPTIADQKKQLNNRMQKARHCGTASVSERMLALNLQLLYTNGACTVIRNSQTIGYRWVT
jgi:hypothetical protein